MSHDWDEILIESFEVELQSATAHLDSMNRDLIQVCFERDEARHRLHAIETSMSWKLTVPLRKANSILRKLIQRIR